MKAFTIRSGEVSLGAKVEAFQLSGTGVTIPAILVGEKGRGRKLGVLPVQLLPDSYKEWQEKGEVVITAATVAQTKAGKPKLIEVSEVTDTGRCVCVFRTKIGYRGGNSHTGDRKEEYWVREWYASFSFPESVPMKERYTWEEVQRYSREYLKARYPGEDISQYSPNAGFRRVLDFPPFPGEILCEGIIAQGAAGRMGSGTQLVAVMPAGVVFRTGYSGRLYGAPAAHYYIFRDGQILSATWEEREAAEIF
jgi:hypothetical protein